MQHHIGVRIIFRRIKITQCVHKINAALIMKIIYALPVHNYMYANLTISLIHKKDQNRVRMHVHGERLYI